MKPYTKRRNYIKIWTYVSLTNLRKLIKYIKIYGFKVCKAKILNKLNNNIDPVAYQRWFDEHKVTQEEMNRQKEYVFQNSVLVSIIVPVYNAPEEFLREMIESVINQTYQNWELCLADGGSQDKTINILREYEKKDSRIKVKCLMENKGISENTNSALGMVTGAYIALLDHDDVITPDALFEIMKVINKHDSPEFIYTDEDKMDSNSGKLFEPHFKPDFSPDTLRSYNYITHFSVFSKELLKKVGDFNPDCDGSQDYDMILRLTEKSNKIFHIPKILYHWRMHQNSVSLNPSSKLYAYKAAKKALANHLDRIGLKGEIVDGKFLGSYKEEYRIESKPLVSIIMLYREEANHLDISINSILNMSTYINIEILIVSSDKTIKRINDYTIKLEKTNVIKVIKCDVELNNAQAINYASKYAQGEYLILLNNGIKIITKDWIEQMIMYCQRDDVAIVGGKLYYTNNRIYNSGIVIGVEGSAGKIYCGGSKEEVGYYGRGVIVQNLSAVSSECMMIKRNIFNDIDGFNSNYYGELMGVDLCLKLRRKGYLVVLNPYAELYINKIYGVGKEEFEFQLNGVEKDITYFTQEWCDTLKSGDPFYNVNLNLDNSKLVFKE